MHLFLVWWCSECDCRVNREDEKYSNEVGYENVYAMDMRNVNVHRMYDHLFWFLANN